MFGRVLKFRLFKKIKASTEKYNLARSNTSVPYSTLPDALEYAHQLKSSWIWTDEHFNPNKPSWIVLHGEERWDQNGLNSIICLFEIPTIFSFSHYLYVYAQQGDILCSMLDGSLAKLKEKIPDNFHHLQKPDEEALL